MGIYQNTTQQNMGYEEQLTIACNRYMSVQYPNIVMMHIANERHTSPRRGAKLKKMGVRKGVADFFIAHPVGSDSGLWIEIKVDGAHNRRKSYPTASQKEFLFRMHQAGYATKVCWSFDEFKHTVDQYLSGEPIFCEYLEGVFQKLMEEAV